MFVTHRTYSEFAWDNDKDMFSVAVVVVVVVVVVIVFSSCCT